MPWHFRHVRFAFSAFLLALACLPAVAADKEDKPLGRTVQQRFNASMAEQQALVFDTRSGAAGDGRSIAAGSAQTKGFQFNQRYSPAKYEAGEFQTKKSWFGNFKFGSKSAQLSAKSEIPNANAAAPLKAAPMKTATTKEAHDSGKTAAVRDLADRDRPYLGPERKKLERPLDPASVADWRDGQTVINGGGPIEKFDSLKPLSVEDVRELLNKNK
jgi:hypothetical protein